MRRMRLMLQFYFDCFAFECKGKLNHHPASAYILKTLKVDTLAGLLEIL